MNSERKINIWTLEVYTGMAADTWRGKCYLIAMALLACEKVDGELVTGYYHYSDNVVDHGWVKYPDGAIADPTRWTIEDTTPTVYRGKETDNYDEDGKRWEAELDELGKRFSLRKGEQYEL